MYLKVIRTPKNPVEKIRILKINIADGHWKTSILL